MSQHDFDIANQSASSARADINNALKALASLSSGATEPSTKRTLTCCGMRPIQTPLR